MMDKNMQLALNDAMGQWGAAYLRSRAVMGNVAGPLDQKRCQAWVEYGWPEAVDFAMLFNVYSRQSLAFGAVDKLVSHCWKTNPHIIEGTDNAARETAWEDSINAVADAEFWQAFEEADRRRLVGRYSLLVLRIADSKPLSEPVARPAALVEMMPLWQSEVTVGPLETNSASPNYNKPQHWLYNNQQIHPDRVFVLGDTNPKAIGYLEPGYNDFVNIEKLSGGSGESFLKNAARQMNINFDKDVKLSEIAKQHGVDMKGLQEVYNNTTRAFNRGIDVSLVTQGASVSAMTSVVPDVEKPYQVSVNSISASIDMPTRILIGNQSGERASTEDQKYWNSRCQSRRLRTLTREAQKLIRKLMALRVAGVEPMAEFTVMWDDLTAPTDADRLENAKGLATINSTQTGAGGGMVFSDNEVREAAGYNPLTAPIPLGEVDDAPVA